MKIKTILSLCALALSALAPAALSAKDVPLADISELPQSARDFLSAHFAGETLAYAKAEKGFFGIKEYEVNYQSGAEIEFDRAGNWKKVECKRSEVPAAIIPEKIRAHIGAAHKGMKITSIKKEVYGYEVELNDKLELKFNSEFAFIGFDD